MSFFPLEQQLLGKSVHIAGLHMKSIAEHHTFSTWKQSIKQLHDMTDISIKAPHTHTSPNMNESLWSSLHIFNYFLFKMCEHALLTQTGKTATTFALVLTYLCTRKTQTQEENPSKMGPMGGNSSDNLSQIKMPQGHQPHTSNTTVIEGNTTPQLTLFLDNLPENLKATEQQKLFS